MAIELWKLPAASLPNDIITAGIRALVDTFAHDDTQYLIAAGLVDAGVVLFKPHGVLLVTTHRDSTPDTVRDMLRDAGLNVPETALGAILLAQDAGARVGWFDVVTPAQVPHAAYAFRDADFHLSPGRIRALLRDVGLEPQPLEEPPASFDFVDVPPGSSADWLQRRMPLLVEHRPDLENGHAGADADIRCLPCRYRPTGPFCDVGVLRGEVQEIDTGDANAGPARFILSTAAGPEKLTLREPWHMLAQPLSLIMQRTERRPTILAYHLHARTGGDLLADDRSLVIIEPDWLVNARALVDADYCPRSYFLSRFGPRTPSQPATRGNIVHTLFEEMVTHGASDAEFWQRAIDTACRESATHLALLDLEAWEFFREKVRPILRRLYAWHRDEHLPSPTGRSETFLLAPQVGLKGRIDALWEDAGALENSTAKNVWVGELKTGKPWGNRIKLGDEMQLAAYVLMALARGWAQPEGYQAFVLYPNGEGDQQVRLDARLNPSVFQQVVYNRNRVVLIDYLGWGPYERERKNKCVKCFAAERCEATTVLLDHTDPRPWDDVRTRFGYAGAFDDTTKRWFQGWNEVLTQELTAAKAAHAALWAMTPEAREREGTTLLLGEPLGHEDMRSRQGSVVYTFAAENRSELRAGDYVLVSEAPGPMTGRMADAQIAEIDETSITLQIDEPLEFEPQVVDQYTSEYLLERQFVPLWLWLKQPAEQRALVIRHRAPRLRSQPAPLQYEPYLGDRGLNRQQQAALERLTQSEDYLLIQGPPGTGKTTLIAALVRECLAHDERVLLAAGTNTAVDNIVLALKRAGLGDHVVRIGNPLRVDDAIHENLPEERAADENLNTYVRRLRETLLEAPVVAATASTWTRGTWEDSLQFEVAIVDEAGQMTLPATLAPLRFAPRFVLIGDHKQLPPVVQSEGRRRMSEPDVDDASAPPRLSRSLFEELIVADAARGGDATIVLTEQYRMNADICQLASDRWYDSRLRPGTPAIATARLSLPGILPDDDLASVRSPESPVIWLDVPVVAGGPPRQNPREANLIADLLAGYLEAGLNWSQVGVIAPFRAQVAAIRRALAQQLGDAARAHVRSTVDTVDRFQGQERDVIIVSLCAYDRFVPDLLRDERRLNVAVTRARHKLILLGDADVLRGEPVYAALLREIDGLAGGQIVTLM